MIPLEVMKTFLVLPIRVQTSMLDYVNKEKLWADLFRNIIESYAKIHPTVRNKGFTKKEYEKLYDNSIIEFIKKEQNIFADGH